MARTTSLTSLKQISEINLTPLMDLTFILLITFIITFPLIEQGVSVQLPKGNADKVSPDLSQTVSIDNNGNIYLENKVLGLDQLRARICEAIMSNPDLSVMVRADERIPYKNVMDVMKILHDAKVSKLALITQAE